jgi:hypothetical protein
MTNYFQAVKAERVFTEYKRLTLAYWEAQPEDDRGWMAREFPALETEESSHIRDQIVAMFEEANQLAHIMRIPVESRSFPPLARGGPIIPINALYAAFDRRQGYRDVAKQDVLDVINRCLAQATRDKKRMFWRQLMNPLWWAIELMAYVLRIPFLILRRAGLPAKIEESIWGNVIKVLFFLLIVWLSLRFGLNLSAKDILGWLK